MAVLLSDAIGVLAGIIFAIPPLCDQYGRWQERRHASEANRPLPKIHGLIRQSLKKRRDAFNGYDTLLLLLGAVLLIAVYLLKFWNL